MHMNTIKHNAKLKNYSEGVNRALDYFSETVKQYYIHRSVHERTKTSNKKLRAENKRLYRKISDVYNILKRLGLRPEDFLEEHKDECHVEKKESVKWPLINK